MLRSGLGGCLMAPLSISLGVATETTGLSEAKIVLGMSAAFSGPSRGLGIELYRGASAYFTHVNRAGGVRGRKIVLKTHDDGYQPDPSVANTLTLMLRGPGLRAVRLRWHADRDPGAANAEEVPGAQRLSVLSLHRRPAAARAALW